MSHGVYETGWNEGYEQGQAEGREDEREVILKWLREQEANARKDYLVMVSETLADVISYIESGDSRDD